MISGNGLARGAESDLPAWKRTRTMARTFIAACHSVSTVRVPDAVFASLSGPLR